MKSDDGTACSIKFQTSGAGGPLLLIHGLPLDSRMFRGLSEVLSEHYTVTAIDLPGFGASIAPPGAEFTLERLITALTAFIDAGFMSNPPAVVGHSMGGYIALGVLAQRPDLIRQVILLNSSSQADLPAKRESRLFHAARLRRGNCDCYRAEQEADCLTADGPAHELIKRVIAENVSPRLAPLLESLARRGSFDPVIEASPGKVGVIAASRDTVRVAEAMRLRRKFDLPVSIVDGCGHMLPFEAPRSCAAALRSMLSRAWHGDLTLLSHSNEL